jgi:hypothetical protein
VGKIGQVAWSILKDSVLCMLANGQTMALSRDISMICLEVRDGILVATIFCFCQQRRHSHALFPTTGRVGGHFAAGYEPGIR